jgi:pyruvate dehydrogenase (quinone)/pyruvate oxidase
MEERGTRADHPMKPQVVARELGRRLHDDAIVCSDSGTFLGNPELGCDLHPIDFAGYARACGATGLTIEAAADCGRVLDQALATPGPVVVEAVVDPFEPPLPSKVALEQATKFAESLIRGEPNRERIALTVLGDRVRELI